MGDVFRQKWKKKDGTEGYLKKWYGSYTDHEGKRQRVALAVDKTSAKAMLAALEKKADRRRAGLDDEFTEAASAPLADLKTAFLADLALRGRKPRYRKGVAELLAIVCRECGFSTVADLKASRLDAYLGSMEGSARTKAKHRQAIIGFANWLVAKGKLESNPLDGSTQPEGETTRKRRALTVDELRNLVHVAESRPLAEALVIRYGPRKGLSERQWPEASLREFRAQGRNNALLYRTAFYTGLRADELRSLWACDLIAGQGGYRLSLPRERTKNSEDANCPIPAALARDLAAWIAERRIGPDEPIFRVPHETAKMLRLDLKAAEIPYRDARGRVADFHSLRVSLASHLNAAGTAPTSVKTAMRHGTITLSLDTYNDASLASGGVRAAVEALPEI